MLDEAVTAALSARMIIASFWPKMLDETVTAALNTRMIIAIPGQKG